MTIRRIWAATALGAAAALTILAGSSALAEEAAETDAAPQEATSGSYEIKDAPDSPPLNYRSSEDERYDTPEQRDAEMKAEQFEKERQARQLRDRKLLDSLNRKPAGVGRLNDNVGQSDEGFPSRPAY